MTINYLEAEMKSEENLFYSTQDADSEGKEGEFYIWDYNQIKKNISSENFKIIKDYWNLTEEGDIDKKNILYVNQSIDEISKSKNISKAKVEKIINDSKNELIKIRNKKVKPNTDNKFITSWNALLISSLCNTYNVTGESKFLSQAVKSSESIMENFIENKNLYHTKNNKISFLEDYSYFTNALFDLYNSSQSSKWYNLAKNFCEDTISLFWSSKDKIFYDTVESNDLIIRPKGFFDPMVPNSAAIAAQKYI